jgi:hypothetical protein
MSEASSGRAPAETDFSDVKLGLTRSISLTVTNVGDEPLQFSEAPYIEVLEEC